MELGLFTELYESDLAENKGAAIKVENSRAVLNINAKKIVTYLLK